MDSNRTGKIIAELRKDAGFTQKSLAEALYVTDKAVSKWERGISVPDPSLLPKLSMLLDADIEFLLAGTPDYTDHKWNGYLVSENLDKIIYDKPVLDYLISYFMLVGIRNIYIETSKTAFVKDRNLEQYGLRITFGTRPKTGSAMIVNGERFIFGVNLTKQFRSYMIALNKTIIPSVDGVKLPIIFTHKFAKMENYYKEATIKPLGRGTLNLPFDEDTAKFVEIYQKHHLKISDLGEIAENRGLFT